MQEQKTFFASLNPVSALIVGGVTGVLVLCTIGFFVLGGLALSGKVSLAAPRGSGQVVIAANQPTPVVPGQGNVVAPPPNVPKADKPKVELFVMSYCPFGLQMQKAYLSPWKLLNDKVDMDIKFVSYAMHGMKEIEENTRQYCIQKEQNDKFIAYLECFATSDDYQSCLQSAGVNASQLNNCVNTTNKQFAILDKYNDQSTWLSGRYPLYPVHGDLNDRYGVQGSPTLVINGTEVQVGRTPEAIKQAVCAGFKNPPAECNQVLSNVGYQPGFGFTAASGNNNLAVAGCGT